MLEVKNLTKIYKPKKGVPVKALDNVSLKIEDKGMVFILGKSGSGKSTLLNLLGGLDKYDNGEIIIKGKSSKNFTQSEFDSYRNTYLGFIFQEYNILDEFSVGANVALAMELQGKKADNVALNKLLKEVDLDGLANRKPNELSGGQKQRIAIARALIKNPEIILADEPTGALDSKTGKQVFETLQKLSKEKLVLIVSHDREFAEFYGDRVIEMADGKVISDIKKYKATSKKQKGISIIDDKILHIQKGYELTAEDLVLINSYIKENKDDTIISVDPKTNIDMKKVARIDNEGNRDAFKKTAPSDIKTKDYSKSPFKLIKSKLSLGKSIKIGASALKYKKIKLVVSVLITTVALTLFGLTDTLAAYNISKTFTTTAKSSGLDYLSISKSEYQSSEKSFEKYIDEIKNVGLKNSSKVYRDNFNFSNKLGYNYNTTMLNQILYKELNGHDSISDAEVPKNQISNYGKIISGRYPKNYNEFMITDYLFNYIKIHGLKYSDDTKVNTYEDLFAKKFYFNNSYEYTKIVGILDTGFDKNKKYENKFKECLKKNEKDGNFQGMISSYSYNDYLKKSKHLFIYTLPGTTNHFDNEPNRINAYSYIESDIPNLTMNIDGLNNLDCNYITSDIYYFNSTNKNLIKNNEIIIPLYFAVEIYNENLRFSDDYYEKKINIEHDKIDNILNKLEKVDLGNIELENKKYKIAGVVKNKSEHYNEIFLKSTEFEKFLQTNNVEPEAKILLAPMPSSNRELNKIVKYVYSQEKIYNGYHSKYLNINCAFSNILTGCDSFISNSTKYFLYIGIGVALFASLIMSSFIANSISYKKHEIGILRAIGARGLDIFKIFGSESMIIALINAVLGIAATWGSSYAINNAMARELPIALFSFGIRQALLILACSILVAIIASFLPVKHFARKKPIDAIRNR